MRKLCVLDGTLAELSRNHLGFRLNLFDYGYKPWITQPLFLAWKQTSLFRLASTQGAGSLAA